MIRRLTLAPALIALLAAIAFAADFTTPYVLAFYYSWYRTPFYSGFWAHWNGSGHNPDEFVEPGRRDIPAAHYPASDVYDSLDPETIARQIEESKEAGINGWIVSWWGKSDNGVPTILEYLSKNPSDIKISIYYEIVPGCGGSDYLCSGVPSVEKIRAVEDDLLYIIDNFGSHPNFLKFGSRPVIFVYTRAIAQAYFVWHRIISDLRSLRAFYISGDSNLTVTDFIIFRDFDQIHFYNPAWQIQKLGFDSLDYCSYVERARARGFDVTLTVIPGYDDTALTDRPGTFVIDRQDGGLYQALWDISISCKPDWILITSFNEWHEGTEIEPSVEYQDQYIEITKANSKRFKFLSNLKLVLRRLDNYE